MAVLTAVFVCVNATAVLDLASALEVLMRAEAKPCQRTR